ncbi:imelysin family protein [Vibrio algarum]|uniref:Imelysin family protein n=1 Tax=Vibrio algarum TaxID=3020714 RepID=A0ABT4YWW3_9VIBR|nr:imelysin family protein [Vibrio sp. KJ40-1]MDB1125882.1 imelysin family protein [Vibrio sp. KJ40-1]
MFTKKTISIVALSLAAIVGRATAESETKPDQQVRIVTEQLIKANYINMAHAAYTDSLITAKTLQQSVQALLANPTNENLNNAKAAYKLARIPYQQSEIMRWDTDITIGAGLESSGGVASVDEWEGQVNAWPLDEQAIDYVEGNDSSGIINKKNGKAITTQYLIDQNGVGGEANVTTGYHAIEFLLWGQDLNGTKAGAGERNVNDFQTDASDLCSASNCDRRREYLSVVTQLLVDDLETMANEWSAQAVSTQGTLANNFILSEDGIRYILFSMKAMATDELASARMNEGLEGRDPEQEHDCFSDLSHVAIYYNLQGIRNAFYGHYYKVDGSIISGDSVSDLIKQKSPSLYQQFDSAFNNIEKNMKVVFDAGEQDMPIRFDQIIGQNDNGIERQAAYAAVYQLTDLNSAFTSVEELLSIHALSLDAVGD